MNDDTMEIKPATRQGVKPLVGLFGPSGSGKTMSALLLARGLVGPQGRIIGVDTESGRMSLFADVVPGGFNVIDLAEPFSPSRYQQAIEIAEREADAVVVDSLTHGWDGPGGVLDMHEKELDRMAGDNWGKREQCKMTAWIKPKMEQKRFVQRLLRLKCPLICCLRAQEKTHIEKKDGKTQVYTDEFTSPIYDPRFIFELTINGEVYAKEGVGGYVHWTKITHPGVRPILPGEGKQIDVTFGERLSAWCSGSAPKPAIASSELAVLKKAFGALLPIDVRKDAKLANQWSLDEAVIDPDWTLETMTAEQYTAALSRLKRKAA